MWATDDEETRKPRTEVQPQQPWPARRDCSTRHSAWACGCIKKRISGNHLWRRPTCCSIWLIDTHRNARRSSQHATAGGTLGHTRGGAPQRSGAKARGLPVCPTNVSARQLPMQHHRGQCSPIRSRRSAGRGNYSQTILIDGALVRPPCPTCSPAKHRPRRDSKGCDSPAWSARP